MDRVDGVTGPVKRTAQVLGRNVNGPPQRLVEEVQGDAGGFTGSQQRQRGYSPAPGLVR